jgi:hypothetical protein
LPKAELQAVRRSTEIWDEYQQALIERRKQRRAPNRNDLKARYEVADEYFKEKKATKYNPKKVRPLSDL